MGRGETWVWGVLLCLVACGQPALADGSVVGLGKLASNAADSLSGFGKLLERGAGLGGVAFIVFGIAKSVAIVRGRAQEGWAYPVTAVLVGTLLIAVPYFAEESSQTLWNTDHTATLLDEVGVKRK